MSCYTDLQKENVKNLSVSYGWGYYIGWAVTVISFGTGLVSLLLKCLPPLNQNPTPVPGQHNSQVSYFVAVPNVNGYQTNYYTRLVIQQPLSIMAIKHLMLEVIIQQIMLLMDPKHLKLKIPI